MRPAAAKIIDQDQSPAAGPIISPAGHPITIDSAPEHGPGTTAKDRPKSF